MRRVSPAPADTPTEDDRGAWCAERKFSHQRYLRQSGAVNDPPITQKNPLSTQHTRQI